VLGEKKSRLAVVVALLLLFSALVVVSKDVSAISVPPYIAIFFEPQSPSEKPLNVQAGSTAIFKVMVLNYGGWEDGNISLNVELAPSWLNITLDPNPLTHITKGDLYNSTMTVRIAEDAPKGYSKIIVHANATLFESDGANRVYRLEATNGISLNITALPVRTTTVTTTETAKTTQTQTVTSTQTTTITNTTTERGTDPSTYAWAVSATVAVVILAVVLLRQRRTKK
jgi:hypothetical protein